VSTPRPRVAFVVQRYGTDITGGSEALARTVAERMTKYFDVDVLTTCATDHLSWKNVHPAGDSEVNGIRVRRFAVDGERQLRSFHSIYDHILTRQLTEAEEQEMLRHQGPVVPALIEYIQKNQSNYGAFIFFTYLYWPTVVGLPIVKEKALLVPTTHDEASLYLHVLDRLFRATPHMLFNSEEERHLTLRRFTLPSTVGRVAGMGIDEPDPGKPDAKDWEPVRDRMQGKQTLAYVGRVENGKGCDELVEFFLRYVKEENRSDLLLLLMGKRTLPLPPHAQIYSTGFVSEYVKYHALAGSTVAVTPSPFESLCIAALESWMHRKPVLANGRCPVLVGHCARSNGGLWYTDYAEFRESLKTLLADDSLRASLGTAGQRYVIERYRWPAIEQVWRESIEQVMECSRNSN
jgi:glycosyltransferase involved in cell wall biosynthesis